VHEEAASKVYIPSIAEAGLGRKEQERNRQRWQHRSVHTIPESLTFFFQERDNVQQEYESRFD